MDRSCSNISKNANLLSLKRKTAPRFQNKHINNLLTPIPNNNTIIRSLFSFPITAIIKKPTTRLNKIAQRNPFKADRLTVKNEGKVYKNGENGETDCGSYYQGEGEWAFEEIVGGEEGNC